MRPGDPREQERAVRAVRRVLALPGVQVHQEGRAAPAPATPVRGDLPQERRWSPGPASRAAHRERLLGVLELPEVRLHVERRTARRHARCRRRSAGAQGRVGDLPQVRFDQRSDGGRHRGRRAVSGRAAEPGGDRAAVAWQATGGQGVGRTVHRASADRRAQRGPGSHPTHEAGRADTGRVSAEGSGPATDPALRRFLRSLEAKDASPHTRRSYATAIAAYLDWLRARGVDWRRPARTDLRAYVAALTPDHARSSVTQRLAAVRTFYLWAARDGLVDGDPWGSVVRPRLSSRLPRVLEMEDILRMLAVVDAELDADGLTPLGTALALRDRALVETAYAAGLRISELAGAELALAGPGPRRAADHGQGSQGAGRAPGRSGDPGAPRLPRGRTTDPPRAAARRTRSYRPNSS